VFLCIFLSVAYGVINDDDDDDDDDYIVSWAVWYMNIAHICAGDTFVSNSGTPSSGTSGSSPLSITVTTSGSSPVSGSAAADAAAPLSAQTASSTPKRQTLKELLAAIPGFSLRVRLYSYYVLF